MSTQEQEFADYMVGKEQNTERAERPVLRRVFSAELAPGDGRTIDAVIVPYGKQAEVSDDRGHTFYREEWVEGAFDDQLVAGHRLKVLMNFEHHSGFTNVVGKGVALRSQPDGLHGTFRILDGAEGDKALQLVRDEILDGISLEAFAKKSVRTVEGVVRRVKAHLHNVALCRTPAFEDARVLAVRDQEIEQEIVLAEEFLPIPIDPEVIDRCRRHGIRLPQRYEAHPDEPDTPAETGTSEDGPRHSVETLGTGEWSGANPSLEE